jgi:glycerate kinase
MRVVVAPDSFKGSLAAAAVAMAIAEGWRSVRPDDDIVLLPQADGGEGTLDAIEAAVPTSVRRSAGLVSGPLGRGTPGEWLELPSGVAVVELAQCCGLPLAPQLDPLRASSRGLGEVIRSAIESGATSLVIGLGGSASTDGGAGALAALGLALIDEQGELIADGGLALRDIVSIDRSRLLEAPAGGVTLLADVTAPLLGPTGSAAVFAPQKGATAAQCAELDAALHHFSRMLPGDPTLPGSGAAGGVGYGFATAWGARITPGAAYLADLTGLNVSRADVVLTGEGRFDAQSLLGKVVGNALGLAARVGVIAGEVALDTDAWSASLTALAGSRDAALAEPARWLRVAGAAAARELGSR